MENINILSKQNACSTIHNLIPLACCNSKQNLMIEIFTDGGTLHQGSLNALAAYGAIFPTMRILTLQKQYQATNYKLILPELNYTLL